MKIIASKYEVNLIVEEAINIYNDSGTDAFIKFIHAELLKKKVRFPLLEFAAKKIFISVPHKNQIEITDNIIALHEIGSNTIVGMILQLRLEKHFSQSINKAIEYIIEGDEWYVCDIIGERVMGYALLSQPEKTILVMKKLSKHSDKWIVRCVGVATHYAVKKGLKKKFVHEMFALLLSLSTVTDFHTKKGVGWAAKTIAKFYPDIISDFKIEIENEKVRQWFRTKIKIGLGRSYKYASRYSG